MAVKVNHWMAYERCGPSDGSGRPDATSSGASAALVLLGRAARPAGGTPGALRSRPAPPPAGGRPARAPPDGRRRDRRDRSVLAARSPAAPLRRPPPRRARGRDDRPLPVEPHEAAVDDDRPAVVEDERGEDPGARRPVEGAVLDHEGVVVRVGAPCDHRAVLDGGDVVIDGGVIGQHVVDGRGGLGLLRLDGGLDLPLLVEAPQLPEPQQHQA